MFKHVKKCIRTKEMRIRNTQVIIFVSSNSFLTVVTINGKLHL